MKSKLSITDVQASTIVRLVVLLIALANLILSVFTDFQIPGLSEASQQAIATIIMAVVSVISYWYNNSWSKDATAADIILDVMKNSDVAVSVEDILGAIDTLKGNGAVIDHKEE